MKKLTKKQKAKKLLKALRKIKTSLEAAASDVYDLTGLSLIYNDLHRCLINVYEEIDFAKEDLKNK